MNRFATPFDTPADREHDFWARYDRYERHRAAAYASWEPSRSSALRRALRDAGFLDWPAVRVGPRWTCARALLDSRRSMSYTASMEPTEKPAEKQPDTKPEKASPIVDPPQPGAEPKPAEIWEPPDPG